MCTSQFEGAEYKSNIGILQFFIQKLSLGKISPKAKILLHLLEYLHTSKFEGNKTDN